MVLRFDERVLICFSSSAQFWNIPIEVVDQGGDGAYLELFEPIQVEKYRRIDAVVSPRTWNMKNGPCYYVGNSQGGPSQSNDQTESVIEGKVGQYETDTLFSTSFVYSQFDESICT